MVGVGIMGLYILAIRSTLEYTIVRMNLPEVIPILMELNHSKVALKID
jgi:hypothetical protein